MLLSYNKEFFKVSRNKLGTPTNSAERAKQMALAKISRMQSDLANVVVIAEQEPMSTLTQAPRFLDIASLGGIIRHIECTMMCPRIAV
jgi:hypothetical protein